MSSLDADEGDRIITILGIEPKLEIPVSYMPPGSLWEAALEEDRSTTELDFPAMVATPDGNLPVQPWMGKAVADFIEVMEGNTLPVFGVENERMGVRQVDLKTGQLVPRKVFGTETKYYITPEQAVPVEGLSLRELLELKLVANYLGFRDLDDIASVKIVTILNGGTYEEQKVFEEEAKAILPA